MLESDPMLAPPGLVVNSPKADQRQHYWRLEHSEDVLKLNCSQRPELTKGFPEYIADLADRRVILNSDSYIRN